MEFLPAAGPPRRPQRRHDEAADQERELQALTQALALLPPDQARATA
ncbi:hypothetical protein [Nonomuraea polychroma]|nr:hypothetical protein [Nonomuraea polychroma]